MKCPSVIFEYAKHFQRHEFDSKDKDGAGAGTHVNMHPDVVILCENMCRFSGKKLGINSAFRTPTHNRVVGGAPSSAHLFGEAVDISRNGLTPTDCRKLIEFARWIGARGVGVAPSFIHIDIKPRDAAWRYVNGKTIPIEVGREWEWL